MISVFVLSDLILGASQRNVICGSLPLKGAQLVSLANLFR